MKRIPKLSAFSSKTLNLDQGSNLKARPPVTPVSNKKTISSSRYKTILLHDWWLVKPQGKGLAVGGFASLERLGERVIFSAPIAKRHQTNVLETQDGITFIVSGFINKSRSHESGFSMEICRHFLFGFPYNWEEYILYASREEHNNGNTGFGDSSTCPLNSAGDALPFTSDDDNIGATEIQDLFTGKGDLSQWLVKKFSNDTAVGTPLKNVPEPQSDPADNMESDIATNTKECKGKDDTHLETSALQDDQTHNIENGSFGFEPGMNMNSPKPSEGLSGKGTNRRATRSISKMSACEKISEDADNFNFRRVTRSVSKMSQTSEKTMPLGKSMKIRTSVASPVRRSARLCNLKRQATQ
ncbi:protein EMBRYO DEFECTIVE 1674 [Senna tora]|uniref:Protein EMBRYO DEFECTIVE 1674 n=1 Tax=Senna tora TaxID=362788 RepID=A0A834SYN7_9FABA|nr:protein EMBRYO DEFECTIVE 1674 [Senna tora]